MKTLSISLLPVLVLSFLLANPAHGTTDGIAFTSERSEFDIATTADRLRDDMSRRGLVIFTEIDHAANARAIGEQLNASLLVIFGDPEVMTEVMQECAQSTGLDLPLKMLVWEDDNSDVWVSYNKWTKLDMRHEFNNCNSLLDRIEDQLQSLAETAAGE